MTDKQEQCSDCGRLKAKTVEDVAAGRCPKWWAIRDEMAEQDCVNTRRAKRDATALTASEQLGLSAEPSEEMLRVLFSLNSGTPRTTEEVKQVYEHLRNLSVSELPQVVINLVIAAREFWDVHNDLTDESSALDKALEAFSDRVPYENQPEA